MKKGFRFSSFEEKFWSRVNKTDSCWLWTGTVDRGGYGMQGRGGRGAGTAKCHRVSYEWAHGPIPTGLWVLHRCDKPPCVNPAHLFLGTSRDNVDDKVAKGRQSRGVGSGLAKISEHDVVDIRSLKAFGASSRDLASAYGVHQVTIDRIVRRANWSHVA
jgi:hypothetical protein